MKKEKLMRKFSRNDRSPLTPLISWVMNWVAIQCHMTTTNSTTTNNDGEYMINCIATMVTVIQYYRGYT